MMNMTANDAMHVFSMRVSDDGVFKGADEINGGLYLLLGIGGKRPIRKTKHALGSDDKSVDENCEVVGPIAKMCEPLDIAHDGVELVAMQHE